MVFEVVKKLFILFSLFFVFFTCISCDKKDNDFIYEDQTHESSKEEKIKSISLSVNTLNLKVGDTYTLRVSYSPSNIKDVSLFWSSGNASVATVSQYGVIVAKKAGVAVIKVQSNDGVYDTCNVVVSAKVCTSCGGAQKIKCNICLGQGTSKCSPCLGTGNGTTCFTCGGKGKTTCNICGGKGQTGTSMQCYWCVGTGKDRYTGRTCTSCKGAGIISNLRTCTYCAGTKMATCSYCYGIGKNRCVSCNGYGKVNCYSCVGNGYKDCPYC